MAQTTELWDIYDSDRNPTGRVEPRGRLVIGDYHLVVHIWLMNEKGEILVTQRAQNKPWGLFWETTGGSVLAGETSLQAAVRVVREEVGLELDPAHGILIDSVRRDRDFLDSWFFQGRLRLYDLKLRPDEVVDAKFISREEYDHMRRGCMFVPTQPDFFQLYDVRLKNR